MNLIVKDQLFDLRRLQGEFDVWIGPSLLAGAPLIPFHKARGRGSLLIGVQLEVSQM